MNQRDLDDHIAGCTGAHQRLLGHLDTLLAADALADGIVSQPSRLPQWTVGHVLTHVARNADSHVRLIEGAKRGEVLDQYTEGLVSRAADIEEGAGRSASEQVADVRRSIGELEATWANCSPIGWAGRWRGIPAGEVPIAELPFRRWREVEIHHADLGLPGFGIDNWTPRYVSEDLLRRTMEWSSRQPMGLTGLPAAALALQPTLRLAWLMGRVTPDGLEPVRFA